MVAAAAAGRGASPVVAGAAVAAAAAAADGRPRPGARNNGEDRGHDWRAGGERGAAESGQSEGEYASRVGQAHRRGEPGVPAG